jgi:alkyl hydroperoxide reductase subunit AhpC
MAPEFELEAVTGSYRHRVRLGEFLQKGHVVLLFHPADWTPTCTEEVVHFNKLGPDFAAAGAQLLDISVDSVYSHIGWQEFEVGTLDFPLCSDFFPHGAVAEAYGVLRHEEHPLAGISERAVFVIEQGGRIAFSKVYPLDIAPKAEAILAEVKKLTREKAEAAG